MSFFNSDLVKKEIEEINELQKKIYNNVFNFYNMTDVERIKHIKTLETLIDKQKVLYTRLSLSDDPEAIKIKNDIIESIILMGMPKDMDLNVVLNNMSKIIQKMKIAYSN
jgi:hypothetical protein